MSSRLVGGGARNKEGERAGTSLLLVFEAFVFFSLIVLVGILTCGNSYYKSTMHIYVSDPGQLSAELDPAVLLGFKRLANDCLFSFFLFRVLGPINLRNPCSNTKRQSKGNSTIFLLR